MLNVEGSELRGINAIEFGGAVYADGLEIVRAAGLPLGAGHPRHHERARIGLKRGDKRGLHLRRRARCGAAGERLTRVSHTRLSYFSLGLRQRLCARGIYMHRER